MVSFMPHCVNLASVSAQNDLIRVKWDVKLYGLTHWKFGRF